MVENNLNNLAETLAKTGLASSTTQAMMMAKNIMGTEKRVSQHFDGKAHAIDDNLSKKSYKEEIQELIEKTSPEKKNFHYMISGYKQDVQKEVEKQEASNKLKSVEKESEPSVSEILKSEKQELPEVKEEISVNVEEFKQPEESIEPVSPTQIPNPVPTHIIQQPSMPVLEEKPAEPVVNQAISQAIEKAQPVYSNNLELDDEMMLKDLMDEQAKEIYSDSDAEHSEPVQEEVMSNSAEPQESVPEYTVFNFKAEKPMTNTEKQEESIVQENIDPVEEEIAKDDDDFILPLSKETPVEQEPYVKEIIQEKTKEFKNPIEKIDLMNHFKFG